MNFREIAAVALDEAAWVDGDDFDEAVFAEDAAVGRQQNKRTNTALEFDLQKHDKRFHQGHYDGKTECKYREKMAAAMGKAGLNPADVKGLGAAGAAAGGGAGGEGGATEPSEAEKKFLELKAKFEKDGQTEISNEDFIKARNEYLLSELGEAEVDCIKKLEEAAKSDGPEGERAEAAADRILNNPSSTNAQKEGAQAILDARKEWKVRGKTYVDLSGMGFWQGMAEAFKAGFEGKEIITDWDKISGRWEQIKSSDPKFAEENGLLQDGVKDALSDLGFGEDFEKAQNIEGLSREQWQEIGYLKYQYDQAGSAKDKHAAWRKLKDYLREQGLEKEKETPVTGGLAEVKANFSGYAPDTDIYEPTPASETDDSFGKDLAKEINDQFAKRKVAAKVTKYKDGSSIVQFRVERDPNNNKDKTGLNSLSDKQLQTVIADIAKDLGRDGQFSYSTASDGSKFTAFVRVNKPKTRDAGLRRLLEASKADKKLWAEIQKMRSPFLSGETAEGKPIWIDLKENGFIGGDPGSGKSERVRSGFAGALHVKTPNQLQLLVNAHVNSADFAHLQNDPHLAGEIADSVEKVVNNYAIANAEWHRREKLFKEVRARDIDHYNKLMRESGKPEEQLPQLQVITDEITNLLQERPDLADEIKKLTTNGRKFGVTHLGSTQEMDHRNMPLEIKGAARFGVRSANPQSSDKIFGQRVQELRNVESKGGMLVKMPDGSIVRVRGTFAGDKNLEHLRDYNIKNFKKGAGLSPEKPTAGGSDGGSDGGAGDGGGSAGGASGASGSGGSDGSSGASGSGGDSGATGEAGGSGGAAEGGAAGSSGGSSGGGAAAPAAKSDEDKKKEFLKDIQDRVSKANTTQDRRDALVSSGLLNPYFNDDDKRMWFDVMHLLTDEEVDRISNAFTVNDVKTVDDIFDQFDESDGTIKRKSPPAAPASPATPPSPTPTPTPAPSPAPAPAASGQQQGGAAASQPAATTAQNSQTAAASAATKTVPASANVTNLTQSQVKRAEALTQAQEAGVKAFQAAQPAKNANQKAKLDGLLGGDTGFAEE